MLLVPFRSIHANIDCLHTSLNKEYGVSTISPKVYEAPFLTYQIQNGIPGSLYPAAFQFQQSPIPISSSYLIQQPMSSNFHKEYARQGQLPNGAGEFSTLFGADSRYSHDVSISPALEKKQSSSILLSLLSQPLNKENAHSTSSPSIDNNSAIGTGGSTSPKPYDRKLASRFVGLKHPESTCNIAAKVLVKIINFAKNLSSFKNLCNADQISLFQNCWVELFIVGMAQEKVAYETVEYELTVLTDTAADEAPCALHAMPILRHHEASSAEEATKIKSLIHRYWELNLSAAEYAYFMGTLLFDPDISGLQERDMIACLQAEAQHALVEYRGNFHCNAEADDDRRQQMRLALILLGLPTLKSIKIKDVIDLFFRPVFGSEANLERTIMSLMDHQR